MPAAQVAPPNSSAVRQKPNTRSSIRQSLTFGTMGRILTDVIHKENKEAKDVEKEKPTKRAKDVAARRSSLQPPPRHSIDVPSATIGKKEKITAAEVKTITRHTRRNSAIIAKAPISSSDERSSSPSSTISPKGPVTRAATLRSKAAAPPSSFSTLPKPKTRPRSLLAEPNTIKRPPSPARGAIRRRPSSSDDEREDDEPKGKGALQLDMGPVQEETTGKISPRSLPGALKVNLTAAINVRPSTPEKTTKPATPTSTTPTRPTGRMSPSKLPKSTPSKLSKSTVSAPRAPTARAPSVASSSGSSHSPHTPKTPSSIKGIFGSGQKGSPLRRGATLPPPPESPLGRVSSIRKKGGKSSPVPSASTLPSNHRTAPVNFSEGSSIDSMDANDVEFMLSSYASPTGPTPAIPRFRKTNSQDSNDSYDPQTPSRPGFLPSRANLSYISPAPPSSDNSPFLRPHPRKPGNDRGSILSWEQLAQHSKSLGQEDIGSMLSDIPAPFRSGAVSPALSVLPEIPDSPSFPTLPSPTGYGSISQVLLPDVTPSPAIHNLARFDHMPPLHEEQPEGGAMVMQLRLQLASLENQSRISYERIQSLESQLANAKEARLRDASELAKQISELEAQIHGNLKVEEQRLGHVMMLEEQISQERESGERKVQEALKKAGQQAVLSRKSALKARDRKWTLGNAAREASVRWRGVAEVADGELEMIRQGREMLAVLLAGLDQSQRQLKCCAF